MGKHFLWDPVEDNIVKEIDDSGSTIADYTTEPYLYGDLISQHRDGQSSFYHYDGQGSTTSLTDSAANVTDTYAYSAFGEVTERTGSTVNPFQYMGRMQYYRNGATESYDVRRRSLQKVGRWLSLDPMDQIMTPLTYYVYGYNNPVLQSDPSGLIVSICECALHVPHKNHGETVTTWSKYSTLPCQTACCSKANGTGMRSRCTGTAGILNTDETLLASLCKGVALCPQCSVASCEKMVINILLSFNWANSQAIFTVSGWLEQQGFGAYGGRCHYWSAEFHKQYNSKYPNNFTIPPSACLGTPTHIQIDLVGQYKDHSINYIKNKCSGGCLIVDDGFWGKLGQVYDPCTVKPGGMSSAGTAKWNGILAVCGCPGKAIPLPKPLPPPTDPGQDSFESPWML